MHNINYYSYSWDNASSGGGIFDNSLVGALREWATVHEHAIPMIRGWTLPVWNKRTKTAIPTGNGGVNIVSHEFLYAILDSVQVDCYIVHNYFTEFDFQKLRIINPLYRLGSEKIFRRIFSASKRVVFLSAREKRLATERYPEFAKKFLCKPPGNNVNSDYHDGSRDANIIEMPGTLDWPPKKLSYLLNVARGLPVEGTLVSGDRSDAFITIIFDSFLSGFKLKLVEMAKHGKSIITFCDLKEEMAHIGFEDLPYQLVGNRVELGKAITRFRKQGDLSQERRREFYRKGEAISWAGMAEAVLGLRLVQNDRPPSSGRN